MHITTKNICALALLSIFSPACLADNPAQFTLSGKSSLEPDCFKQAFPLHAQIAAARTSEKTMSLFFESATVDFDLTNSIVIQIYQPATARNNLTKPTPFSAPRSENPVVAAKVTLFAACPNITHSFYLDGEVIFTALGSGKNARMAGSITDARILNARTNEVVAEGLSGSWDFKVEPGQPHQTFYAFP